MTDSPLTIRDSSAWDESQIRHYLDACRHPLRVAIDARDGPLIVPLWFCFRDGAFYCASRPDAFVVEAIRQSDRCGFDLSDNTVPYRGVRGQGKAAIVPDEGPATLRMLVARYLGNLDSEFARWLLSRSEDEVAIVIRPEWITAWDFGKRMQGLTTDRQPLTK